MISGFYYLIHQLKANLCVTAQRDSMQNVLFSDLCLMSRPHGHFTYGSILKHHHTVVHQIVCMCRSCGLETLSQVQGHCLTLSKCYSFSINIYSRRLHRMKLLFVVVHFSSQVQYFMKQLIETVYRFLLYCLRMNSA